MIMVVQASRNFDDYAIFMRGIEDALKQLDPEDNQFLVYTAGPVNLNSMVMEFCNVSERSLKSRGIRIKYFKIPPYWAKDNYDKIDYFAYFCKPKEPTSELVKYLDNKELDVWVYQF